MPQARIPVTLAFPLLTEDSPFGGEVHDWRSVAAIRGLTETQVLHLLGRPAERVSPTLWVYWRYYSPEEAAENGGYDTLLVAFKGDRVQAMKLVDGATLRAQLQHGIRPLPLAAVGGE